MRSARTIAWVLCVAAATAAWASKPSQRPSDAARGRELYARHCVQCHGPLAAGDGPIAAALVAPVPDLRAALTEERQEAQVDVVLEGLGAMPGFSLSFDRYDARRVWRAMRAAALGEPEVEPGPVEDAPPADSDGDQEGG